ncbi:hypothetical protein KDW54_07070 [Burkholderia ambifaria]|uniref:hypothetical protein n=1 Tax=Burkholderia ambifaria TaxID=152480 RepID=UPI001B965F35|nr:hypothetical protein [Burkholderia ambifaria]MBR8182156.1 hypothetical protein [Burkholderia ambifaria]
MNKTLTEAQINRRWVEILIDTLSLEKPTKIGPNDASCFVNALRGILATQKPEPAKCSDGGSCGAGGYCDECPQRQQEPRDEVTDCRIWEYDGAFKCMAHQNQWGAIGKPVIKDPDAPCAENCRAGEAS